MYVMEIYDNEFDTTGFSPIDDIGAQLGIIDAADFLDERYRDVNRPAIRRMASFLVKLYEKTNRPLGTPFNMWW
jgi:hypothetical protein